ncbi:MAG: AzlD domain-containing protein [Lachnospiraceae bacterium]|nr:AzlD domain-containing protein [Lachnospiraceae bacterium]
MSRAHAMISVAIMALVTIMIRFLPFVIFGKKQNTPKIITYLGKVLPHAIMAMLVVYCLKNISFASVGGFLPELIAGAATAGLYVWKKNTLLSIGLGTVIYMLLVQLVF